VGFFFPSASQPIKIERFPLPTSLVVFAYFSAFLDWSQNFSYTEDSFLGLYML